MTSWWAMAGGFALQLIAEGTHYFLSRPRRFGKSLFLDTLAELFASNEPLFRGLYAQNRWNWAKSSPVIRLSFGGGVLKSHPELEQKIRELLGINQAALGIRCEQPTISGCFGGLIRNAHAATGERVVVLVDEYDKPILDNLTAPEIAREMRDGLRNLYSVIRSCLEKTLAVWRVPEAERQRLWPKILVLICNKL